MARFHKLFKTIALCWFIITLISGCKSLHTSDNNIPTTIKSGDASDSITTIPSITLADNNPLLSDEQQEESITDNCIDALNDLSEFKSLQDCFLDYKITKVKGGFMEGSYDLNMDGKPDSISLLIKGRPASNKSLIEVNDTKLTFYLDRVYDKDVRLIDLDINDNYIEVACRDDGPSDDIVYIFFRYCGKELVELGSISSNALINGQGKLISGFNINQQFKPTFCSAWYEIENNTMVKKVNDVAEYLDKTYDFSGGEAYFIPSEKATEDIEIEWGEPKFFEACKVKIIDILHLNDMERILNFYFVELPSGDKGLLYFWIGD